MIKKTIKQLIEEIKKAGQSPVGLSAADSMTVEVLSHENIEAFMTQAFELGQQEGFLDGFRHCITVAERMEQDPNYE